MKDRKRRAMKVRTGQTDHSMGNTVALLQKQGKISTKIGRAPSQRETGGFLGKLGFGKKKAK